ncbi:MbtH family protein [Corynebacterium pygosceleis]|uniref:MbtH family NRPS accessory protein n=1 Tax=Corynebacterium pygosceleis TaxID=2800406 RepID=A0A9Q4C8Q9_9CORY|nr:MbtH family NRPS accessory protein [Corynebacterium pygosceleis]MCK7637493.1 MbtH family NRPS accessory protein [Corynebacterium pygosceleis]MCK7674680.1 MbtH family NRPS accessory protein [Corynebacterium pygosceleis]MCL0119731.1 MbtH family NRPS accessory protein [Corynebacterium pygosceleis]MCX7444978.1 MbtH family NRPS accessory protein [Corynebacterium pygosceleis]MCX7468178.1 MbtH family NRPS accessory protein [Corynebacterium pygosceleis]
MHLNPFDDPDGVFYAVINDELQYALWPDFREPPSGWKVVHGPGRRAEILRFIEENWTDMRPLSVRRAMDADHDGEPENTGGTLP